MKNEQIEQLNVYFVGNLPWFIHDPKREYLLVGEWKKFARGPGRKLLLGDSPQEFEKILDIIDQTAYFFPKFLILFQKKTLSL